MGDLRFGPDVYAGAPVGDPVTAGGLGPAVGGRSHRGTRHHRMYMSAKSPHHHKTMKTGQSQSKQPQ